MLDGSLGERIARKFLHSIRVEPIAARRRAGVVRVRGTAGSRNRLLSYEGAGDDDALLLPGRWITQARLPLARRIGRDGDRHRPRDPRCQAILEQVREREIEQAIDRLRLVHREKPARFVVLTNIPLDLTVDRLTTWREPLPDRLEATAGRLRGCLPLTPSELARLAPDVWAKADAAKARMHRAKGVQTPEICREMHPLPRPLRWPSTGCAGPTAA